MTHPASIQDIFASLGVTSSVFTSVGLSVSSPHDGAVLGCIAEDDAASLAKKITRTEAASKNWRRLKRVEREARLQALSQAIKSKREALGTLIHIDGGKTMKEGLAETDSAADVIIKTINDASLPDFGGMKRVKERPPVGLVGLITSFNFPLVVAHWTLAPALLAGNAVLWKPSEKTPLPALALKAVFDAAMGEYGDLLQLLIGGRALGEALVAHESVDMICATGSVGMGNGIKATLALKRNHQIPPILELGGNNGVIISDKMSPAHLTWSLGALMNSFLGTTGQRCTNTRRLIVQSSMLSQTTSELERLISEFLRTYVRTYGFDLENPYGYGPLIDMDALARFERAKADAVAQGGKILLGARRYETLGGAYVEPALAILPKQTAVMHEETFAPLLFIAPYGEIGEAITLLNAPANAGLVGAIYTQSQAEADRFAAECEAGHALINPPKGTGTPAFGMGFGGNKDSGCGEILNSVDPLAPFTRRHRITRIAQNAEIAMEE